MPLLTLTTSPRNGARASQATVRRYAARRARDIDGECAGESLEVDAGAGAQRRNDTRVVDETVPRARALVVAARGARSAVRRPGLRGRRPGRAPGRLPRRWTSSSRLSSASKRAATVMRTPRCASCRARMVWPIPRPPPVIIAVLSSRWVMECSCVVGGVVLHRRRPRPPPWVGFVEIDDAGQMKRLMAGVQEIVAELLDTRGA